MSNNPTGLSVQNEEQQIGVSHMGGKFMLLQAMGWCVPVQDTEPWLISY
jgi:hypothetical protein